MALKLYSQLLVKTDPRNLAQVQAEIKKSLSTTGLDVNLVKPGGIQDLNKALANVRRESTGLVGDFQKLGLQVDTVFRRFSAYLIASGGILTGITLIKSAIGEAIKFQDELVKIKQVSGDSDRAIKELSDTVGRLAINYGVSSRELVKSAVTLKQAGLTARETRIAIEALAKTDLAPNFDNITKTTEGLIAVFQQFGKNINNIESQLGSMNAVAGAFATEAADLITVVQKAGGAAASSGANLEELLALFTSVRSTTRESADAIATGLRTIFGRLQRPDTIKFLDELGIKLRYTSQEAEKMGKADLAGKFVGPMEAIMRLNAGTSSLGKGSTLFSNIIEEIGGLRQISRVVPLIREASLAVEAYNVALAGKGSLDIQALQKQDSYLNRLAKIKEEFLAIGRTLVESEGFDRFIRFLTTAATAATQLLNAIGPLLPYLGAIAGINIVAGSVRGVVGGVLGNLGMGANTPPPIKRANGGIIPGASMGDRIPALLEGGEAVIPAKNVRKYSSIIPGLISGNLRGFAGGGIIGSFVPNDDDLKRALVEFAKKTGINPTDYFKDSILSDKVMSKSHPGRAAKGRASSSGQLQLNPTQFSSYRDFYETVAHETGHFIDRKKGIRQDKESLGYLNSPEAMKKYSDYAKGAKQSFVPQGPMGIPYAMKIDERIANAFAMGDKNIIGKVRSKDDEASARAFVKANSSSMMRDLSNALLTEKSRPTAPSLTPLSSGFSGTFSGFPNPFRDTRPTGGLGQAYLYKGYGGRFTGVGQNRDESRYNDIIGQDFNKGVSGRTVSEAAALQKRAAQLRDTIAELELGRKQGRNAFPGHFKGDPSKYDFSSLGLGANAQAYLTDKGGYLGNLRQQQANLSDIQSQLKNIGNPPSNPYSVKNIMQNGGIGTFGVAGMGSGGGWGGWKQGTGLPGIAGIGNFNGIPPVPPNRGGNTLGNWGGFGGFGSGGSGGSGGTGSGASSSGGGTGPNNGIQANTVTDSLRNSNRFNALSSVVGIGIPAGLAIGAATSKDSATQTKFGSASLGASIGGALGSPLGPLGTILGSAIGGVMGWFRGASVAAEELEKTTNKNKVDEAIDSLNTTIVNIGQGSGSISDLADKLKQVKESSLKKAIADTKDGGDYIKASTDEFRKAAGLQLPELTKITGEEIKKQAKSGRQFSIFGELESVVNDIARLRQTSVKNVKDEFEKLYDSIKVEVTRKEAESRFTIEINKSVMAAESFANAVDKASQEVQEMDKRLQTIVGGGYGSASYKVGEFGSINKSALSNFGGLSGGRLSGLTSEVSNVDQISKFLPEVLSRTVKPGEQNNDNLGLAFESAFASIAQQTGTKFDKKIINVLSDKLQMLKSDDLFEDMKKAPEKFAKDLVKSFDPSLKALQAIGKDLEDRDKAYQDGLKTLLQMNDRISSMMEQRAMGRLQLTEMSRNFDLTNAGVDPSRVPNAAGFFKTFRGEQDRLLGVKGIGENPAAIQELMQKEKANIDILRKKAEAESNSAQASTKFRDALYEAQQRYANYNRALERLIDTSGRLAKINEEIAAATAAKDAKVSFTTKLLTASPAELFNINRDAYIAKTGTRMGLNNVRGTYGDQGVRELQGALTGTYKDQAIPSRFSYKDSAGNIVHLLGEQIWKRLEDEANKTVKGPLNANPERAKIKQNQELAKNAQAIASGAAEGAAPSALDVMISNLQAQQTDFKNVLTENNNAFFAKIDQYITELQKNALQSELSTKNIKDGELSDKMKGINDIPAGTDIEDAKRQIGLIKQAQAAKKDLDEKFTESSNVGKEIDDFVVKLTDSKGLMKSEDIMTEIDKNFNLTDKQRNNVMQGLNKRGRTEQEEKDFQSYENNIFGLEDAGMDADFIKNNPNYKRLKQGGTRRLRAGELLKSYRELETQEPYTRLRGLEKRLTNPNLGNLSPDAIKAIEGGDIEKTRAEFEKNKAEIRRLQGLIDEKNKPKNTGAAQIGGQSIIDSGAINERDELDPRIRNNILSGQRDAQVPLGPQLKPGGKPIPSNDSFNQILLGSFERANEVFTSFTNNFAKQVEALANIPRVIDMNINQRVELIINGAEALTRIEPGVSAMVESGISRAMEQLGEQLRDYNIRINI